MKTLKRTLAMLLALAALIAVVAVPAAAADTNQTQACQHTTLVVSSTQYGPLTNTVTVGRCDRYGSNHYHGYRQRTRVYRCASCGAYGTTKVDTVYWCTGINNIYP